MCFLPRLLPIQAARASRYTPYWAHHPPAQTPNSSLPPRSKRFRVHALLRHLWSSTCCKNKEQRRKMCCPARPGKRSWGSAPAAGSCLCMSRCLAVPLFRFCFHSPLAISTRISATASLTTAFPSEQYPITRPQETWCKLLGAI